MSLKVKEVEIGLLDRNLNKVFVTTVDKDEQIYFSIGSREDYDNEGEYVTPIYSFESNVELFTLPVGKSDSSIHREFLKKYKILKPGAVKRFRKEGLLTEINGELFLLDQLI